MRKYNLDSQSDTHLKGVSLAEVINLTDWSDEEIDRLAELQVGEKSDFDGIKVERVK